MGIQTALDLVQQADRLIDAMRLADDLAFEASRDGGQRTIRVLGQALLGDDELAAIAATHALAKIFDDEAESLLAMLLSSERTFLQEHAAWAIGARVPRFDSVGRLVGLVVSGGFAGMLAQRTLEQWTVAAPDHVAVALEGALLGIEEPGARSRLVETFGLVRNRLPRRPLLRIATDAGEHEHVRIAAVSALGQRLGDDQVAEVLRELAKSDGELAAVARLSLLDLQDTRMPERQSSALTVAQLFLNADIDAGLEQAGRGDNGGIATLLVRLGDALIARESSGPDAVGKVITMSRGSVSAAIDSVTDIAHTSHGHTFGRIPLLSEPLPSAAAWPLRVTARRGIRRLLRASPIDVLHLRMADVGSLAAVDAARELNIPTVFTVAPDPHSVINSLDLSGQLTRGNFGQVDALEHFWFRTRLVRRVASNASHTVLFPRPELKRDLLDLVGIDITAYPERHTIVPEGIDLGVVDVAVGEASAFATGGASGPALDALTALLASLPPERRGLPLIVSVGRLHRVKGMATIVQAWAESDLREHANVLIIGGDMQHPSADEREQLDRIDALVPPESRVQAGLLLPGHQPNNVVARWVAAARFGVPGLAAPLGIYVCGSVKEEFGIALLEAMATGLLVVAPDGGGPATYVERGVTGFLARTWNVAELADAIHSALSASLAEVGEAGEARATRSRATVEKSFTIQAMAESLASVYSYVVEQEHIAQRQHRDLDGSTL